LGQQARAKDRQSSEWPTIRSEPLKSAQNVVTELYNPSKFMPDSTALESYYKTLTDRELLNLRAEHGFTEEAEQVLGKELARRHLASSDVKKYVAAAERNNLRDEVVERGGGYRSIGLQFFGKSFLNESDRAANILVRTKWFTISGIPLIPIASYRFKSGKDSKSSSLPNAQRSVINRVPLNWTQVFMTFAKTALLLVGAVLLVVAISWLVGGARH
jgi:hypothetical protein